jgi:hypothetical protein
MKDLKAIEDPRCRKSKTDTADPSLAKLLSDRDAPK